jgi:hypothetical protein
MIMKNYIFILLILALIPLATAETIYRSNGNIALQFSANDRINTTLVPSNYSDYEWQNINIYTVYFDNNPNSGGSALFISNGTTMNYFPYQLNYNNAQGSVQMISAVQSITGGPSGSNFVYPGIYGTGYNLTYTAGYTGLKENLIIASRSIMTEPSASMISGGNVTLALGFQASFSDTVNLIIDGVAWDKRTDAYTANQVLVRDSTGKTVYRLAKPIATDAVGNKINLTYAFKKSANKIYVFVHTPFSWLNNTAIYPVNIDPTLIVIDDYNVTMVIVPENTTCIGTICGSDIDFINSGTTSINFNSTQVTVNITGSTLNYLYYIDPSSQDTLLASDGYNITIAPGEQRKFTIYSMQNDTGIWKYAVYFNYAGNNYIIDPYYIATSDTTQNSTSSTSYVTKLTNTFTLPYNSIYAVFWIADSTSSSTTREVWTDLYINGATSYGESYEQPTSVTTTAHYPARGGLYIGSLASGSNSFAIRWHRTNPASATIRNARIIAVNLPIDATTFTSDGNTAYTSALTASANKSFTVSSQQEYFIFASAVSATSGTNNMKLYVDSNSHLNTGWTPKSSTDYINWFGLAIVNLSAGTHNMMIMANSTATGGTNNIRFQSMLAIPLTQYYYWWTKNDSEVGSTSTTYANHSILTFNVTSSGQHLIVGTATMRQGTAINGVGIRMSIDGIVYCDSLRVPSLTATTDTFPFHCEAAVNLTTGNHTANIEWARTTAAGTAYINQSKILAFGNKKDPCNPENNQDWTISTNITCDGVKRTTGLGKILLSSTGTLSLINSANVSGNGCSITRALPWHIMIQRGSGLKCGG